MLVANTLQTDIDTTEPTCNDTFGLAARRTYVAVTCSVFDLTE